MARRYEENGMNPAAMIAIAAIGGAGIFMFLNSRSSKLNRARKELPKALAAIIPAGERWGVAIKWDADGDWTVSDAQGDIPAEKWNPFVDRVQALYNQNKKFAQIGKGAPVVVNDVITGKMAVAAPATSGFGMFHYR